MAYDNDRVSQRLFSVPLGVTLRKPIFFNNAIYAVTTVSLSAWIDTYKVTLSAEGVARDLNKVPLGSTELLRHRCSLATCFYGNRIHLFFDSELANDDRRFEIRFKTTPNPADGWAQAAPEGLPTGLFGSYHRWGAPLVTDTIAAREMGGKIYLFYYRDEAIWYATYDGKQFKEIAKVTGERFLPFVSTCSVVMKKEPAILYGGFPVDQPRKLHLTGLNDKGLFPMAVVDLDGAYAKWDNLSSMAHGSVKDGDEANELQLFFHNGGPTRNDLRRLAFNLDTVSPLRWYDTTIDAPEGRSLGFVTCDVVTAAVNQGGGADFRQYIVVFSAKMTGMERSQTVASYPSDFFKCEFTSESAIDTGHQDSLQPDAWTVLGVVEGVPPFTRNGVVGSDLTSSVDYGQSTSDKVTVGQKFDSSLAFSVGGAWDKIFEVSAEIKAEFGVSNEMTKTINSDVLVTLANNLRNADGSEGWMIVSKPSLRGRRYTRLTYAGKHTMGSFLVVSVEDVSISLESYKLTDPPAGMLARKNSSDIRYWLDARAPRYLNVDDYPINALLATLTGGTVKGSLKISQAEKRSTRVGGKLTLKAKGTKFLSKLFKIDVGATAEFSFSSTLEITSEFTQSISASLRIPNPDPRDSKTVTRLAVKPWWFVAKEGAHANRETKPFWLANEHLPRGYIPWCLTWQVTEIRYEDGTALLEAGSNDNAGSHMALQATLENEEAGI